MKQTALLICSLLVFGLHAQFDRHYEPLRSQAPIPRNIRTKAYEKTYHEQQRLGEAAVLSEEFIEYGNYQLDQLLRSPNVLFNTELNDYANALLDQLTDDEPELRRRMTVYVLRSSAVNAFTTDRGDLFLNIGLLDRLNDGHELAFILAHELTHTRERHSMEGFTFEVTNELRYADAISKSEQLAKSASFSRAQELEADRAGLQRYLAAGFDPAAPERTLRALAGATEFPDRSVDVDQLLADFGLDHTRLRLPDSTAADKPIIREVVALPLDSNRDRPERETDRYDFGTHPAVDKRVAQVRKILETADTTARRTAVPDFTPLRERAHFELVETLLLEGLYVPALYQAHWLSQRHPDNEWLRTSATYALYGYAQSLLTVNWTPSTYRTGTLGRLLEKMEERDPADLYLAVVREIHLRHRAAPTDVLFRAIFRDVVEDIAFYKAFDPDSVLRISRPELRAELQPILVDVAFQQHLTRGRELRDGYTMEDWETGRRNRTIRKRNAAYRKQRRRGFRLGRDSVIAVAPRALSIDADNGRLMPTKSERAEENLRNGLRRNAERLSVSLELLDPHVRNDAQNIAAYRDTRELLEWIAQVPGGGNLLVPRNHREVVDLQERRAGAPLLFLVKIAQGRRDYVRALVFDPSELRLLMDHDIDTRMGSRRVAMQQILYWILFQINR